jgi:hypothetical protein
MKLNWQIEINPQPVPIYMSKEYQSLFAEYDGCVAKVLKITSNGKTSYLPLLIKDIGNDYKEAYSAYGYGGIWGNLKLNISDVEKLRHFLAAESILAVFIRNSPFLQNENYWPRGLTELNRKTYIRKLKPNKSIDDCIAEFPQKIRWSFNRASRSGLRCKFLPMTENPKKKLSCFYRLYANLMDAKETSGYLSFSEEFFLNHIRFLRGACELIELVSPEDENLLGGALFLLDSVGRAHYHLSAATEKAMKMQGMELLLATSIYRYGNMGYKEIHLGGGHKLDESDGLSRFKSKFADQKLDFHCMTMVCDEAAYARERARLPLSRPSLFLISDARGGMPTPTHLKYAGQV